MTGSGVVRFEWTNRVCPLCGSNRESRVFAESNIDLDKLTEYAFASRKLPEYMHPRLVECSGCGLLYGNPVLSTDSLSSLYREAAFDGHTESEVASFTYKRVLQRYINELPDRTGAIDIGAADGTFCERLLELGFSNVVGVEPSEAPIAAAKPQIRQRLRCCSFRAGDFTPNSVSLISCLQVMEHIPNPQEIVSDAFHILKTKGLLFVIAHNQRAFSARLLGCNSPIYDIEHLQLFTKESGRRLLQSVGFERVRVFPIWNRYPMQYWMRLFPLPPRAKGTFLSVLKSSGIGAIQVPLPAGNIVLIGFKP